MGGEAGPRRALPLVALAVCIALITGTPSVATGTIHETADEPTALGDAEGCSTEQANPSSADMLGPPRAAAERADLADEERGFTDLEACTGAIRPGAEMTAPSVCTLNFVFTDGNDFFVGTAGHCVEEGDRVRAQDVGSFGTVVMKIFDGNADDFGLIQVDKDEEHLVEPTVCSFGGPEGVQDDGYGTGLPLYEYGWGTATFLHPATRQRAHSHAFASGGMASWNGVGSGGDSGAPVLTDDGDAYAIHTAGVTPVAGAALEGGPTVTHLQGLMAEHGYGHLDLVEGDAFERI